LLEIDSDDTVGEVDRDQAVGIRERLIEERGAGLVEGGIEAREADGSAPSFDGDEADVEVDLGCLSDLTERSLCAGGRIETGAYIGHGSVELGGETTDKRGVDDQLAVGDHVLRGDLAIGLRRGGAGRGREN